MAYVCFGSRTDMRLTGCELSNSVTDGASTGKIADTAAEKTLWYT
jgi:hypothetical protein